VVGKGPRTIVDIVEVPPEWNPEANINATCMMERRAAAKRRDGRGTRGGRKRTMPTVTIEEARSQLSELIHRLTPGEEVVITENDQPVARLSRSEPKTQWPCKAGSAKGKIWMAPDFDAPLEEFKEYME
jgi:antitoxin (DNA-binding transcriptional repressor) of toxin-antitoxin stability system